MVEKSHSGKCHNHTVFIALLDNEVVTDGATGLCNILYTGCVSTLDVIRKGEEGIGCKCNLVKAVKPCALFLCGQRLGTGGEIVLPDAVGGYVLLVTVDVAVDDVIPLGSSHLIKEGEREGLGMLTKEPGIRLRTCKSGAMDTRLLSRADTDSLSVYRVADRIGLCILKGNESNDKVTLRAFGKLLICGDDVFKEMLSDFELVSSLLECDAVDILCFDGRNSGQSQRCYSHPYAWTSGFQVPRAHSRGR